MNTYTIEIDHLSKSYDTFNIKDLNLKLPSGSIMGFIGENGAGKSTTIKLILDLIKKDAGSISILGKNNHPLNKTIKEDIGVVLDESCFPNDLKVKAMIPIMKNLYQNWDNQQFSSYIEKFALPLNKKIKDLSRGMKMKLSLAVALSHGAKLLILDEATSGLDPIIRDEILDIFMEFIQDESHSILVSSHILSDLEKICDYIAFIHEGRLIFSEEKDILIEKYGILKCSEEELHTIDPAFIKAYRRHSFGIEALVEKKHIKGHFLIDPAGLEEIMLYHIKESKS